jgi:hypothetical protein
MHGICHVLETATFDQVLIAQSYAYNTLPMKLCAAPICVAHPSDKVRHEGLSVRTLGLANAVHTAKACISDRDCPE